MRWLGEVAIVAAAGAIMMVGITVGVVTSAGAAFLLINWAMTLSS